MDISKKRSIENAFILLQFSYCPLIRMFHSRKLNHRTNKIRKRTLRIVWDDHQCTFEELLGRDSSFTIHERNLQKLAIEMFKVNNGLSVQLVSENLQRIIIILDIKQEQNLRLIMLKLKHMANNLYHISDLKSIYNVWVLHSFYFYIYIYTHSVWALILGCVDISKISYFSCQHWISRCWHELARCYHFIYCNLFFMPE